MHPIWWRNGRNCAVFFWTASQATLIRMMSTRRSHSTVGLKKIHGVRRLRIQWPDSRCQKKGQQEQQVSLLRAANFYWRYHQFLSFPVFHATWRQLAHDAIGVKPLSFDSQGLVSLSLRIQKFSCKKPWKPWKTRKDQLEAPGHFGISYGFSSPIFSQKWLGNCKSWLWKRWPW